LICTGANPRQVHAIADAIEQALKAKQVRPAHLEGYQRAEWILVDYFDFIVHVFSPSARSFYGLERLWGNATRIDLTDHK
jgi:ribosome-associated protein